MGQNNFRNSLVVNKNNNHKFSNESSKKLRKLLSVRELSYIIQEMAESIIRDYKGKQVGFICVETGARPFYNFLLEYLGTKGLEGYYIGSVKIETDSTKKNNQERKVSKFHDESGILLDKKKLRKTHLIVIDDQINQGRTWDLIKQRYSDALSVELAALVILPDAIPRLKQHDVKYAGFIFDSQNSKVVGFGMDYKEYFRLEDISTVSKNSNLNDTRRVANTPKDKRTRTNDRSSNRKAPPGRHR